MAKNPYQCEHCEEQVPKLVFYNGIEMCEACKKAYELEDSIHEEESHEAAKESK